MPKLIEAIIHDLKFIRSHTLQPQWYKVLKVFIILGFLLGYYLLFGLLKTLLFAGIFFLLGLIMHMVYRVKTKKFTTSWLDFIVVEQDGELKTERIGKYYYLAVAVNAILSLIVSQLLG